MVLRNWEAALISILAIVFALLLFSLIFLFAGVNPISAYEEIFSYAFVNKFGLPLTINRFIFLLLCTSAFIIPYRAGLWNIGMTGQLYFGALGAFGALMALGGKESIRAELNPLLLIPLMLFAAAVGGALLAAIAGFLKGKYNINEIVVTMILNFVAYWLVAYMIKEGGPFMNPGGRGESFELPPSTRPSSATSHSPYFSRWVWPCCCTFSLPRPVSDTRSRHTASARRRPDMPA